MTLPDGTYIGTIDRIEEGIAVILIEDEKRDADAVAENDDRTSDREIREEIHCSADTLSQRARDELGVVSIELVDGEIVEIEHQSQATQQRRSELQDRFDELAERPPGRDENQ
ncbi:hypothetical protein [Halalkalicoccus sp. NIPERK01]|uniref:hypothetical protein n=1 Tax=Halalkalicoccus sp. NIPERK01 TaxID=3053469 RepID=UPI00256F11C6|nr:hypothetical protein [Halalkalicoccus sp. NIPERK01]MDL5363859.1 hypothetical protein [Halalkalicoccus sp. NIPERK01]